ncbi:GNAT family N-acetyltransferase [Streptomyces sp. p1417]|uniref:GNAT family N-acetyltransferase n=1 Tax=Streptomyces typhae TaxID=2681492 RepID=A0A6L6X4G3_9ACTN|nr:GNAT family N-acetyltransferase [Streptomyces typhae]MVO88607.1 GNAT family N-acetyltransferase [Streptomyces typhae]
MAYENTVAPGGPGVEAPLPAPWRHLRLRRPGPADHLPVLAVVDSWWGGLGGAEGARQRALLLPRLMFQHFGASSFLVTSDAPPADGHTGRAERIVAFLIGFLSPSKPDESYIHFVGIDPAERGRGLGAALYERFFAYSRAHGRSVVRAITSPQNTGSYAFHTRMGFVTEPGPKEFDGKPVQPDYDGPGLDRLSFRKDL